MNGERVTITLGDARALTLPDESVDAIICDPPYELAFMGKKWDASGVAYDVDMWRGCFRVLKPGGHLLAFGGTRTSHRMVAAIEDAGFEIRDSIIWLYGSGFPKSLDVSKAIDKSAGAERRVIGSGQYAARGRRIDNHIYGESTPSHIEIETAPATDAARQWAGWGTALKPAHEPITVARKPFAGTVAGNVTAYGTGAVNVDGCRVGTDTIAAHGGGRNGSGRTYALGAGIPAIERGSNPHTGRWPSNIILSHLSTEDGDDACADGCVDGCPVAELDGQSGISESRLQRHFNDSDNQGRVTHGGYTARDGIRGHSDTGGASRFFPTFRYQAKAPTRERPEVDGVQHPTVKPLALIRWLCRLVTPPDGLILDPFAGSGTTVEAAILEGFRVVAIENHEPYLALIEARVARAA